MAQFNEYTADGSTTVFVYRFPAFDMNDIEVRLDNAVQGSGWTALGLGGGNGGAIEFANAPASGVVVRIARVRIPQQVAYLVRDENLADLTDTALARQNLGVEIGVDVQAHDGDLDWVAANITNAGKAILDDADAAAQRATLGIYSTTQTDAAIDAAVDALDAAALKKAANLGDVADAAQARTNLGAAAASHSHAAGDIISGTIATARLGSGTADSSTYLRGDGTWAAPSAAAGSWEYVSATPLSGATQVDFSGFASGYDYMISATDIAFGGTTALVLRYGTGSGPTFQSSSYQFASAYVLANATSPTIHSTATDGSSAFISLCGSDSGISHLEIQIPNPTDAFKHVIQYTACADYGGVFRSWQGHGYRAVSEALTAIRLYTYTGVGMTGSFLLYRRKRSA